MIGFFEEYGIICFLFYKVNNDMIEVIVIYFVFVLFLVLVNGNVLVWNDYFIDK